MSCLCVVYTVCMFVVQPFSGHGDEQRSTFGAKQCVAYSFPFCLLPVTFPAIQSFHTGRTNRYRSGQQNRQLLSVEGLVKLHFSVKARFSEEAAVVLSFFL